MGCGSETEVLDVGVEGDRESKWIPGGGNKRAQEKSEEGERACVFKKCI